MESIWNKVKASIQTRIPSHCYRMWIEPLAFQKSRKDKLILACPNVFFKRRIKENYTHLIENEIKSVTGEDIGLELEINSLKSSVEAWATREQQLSLPNMTARPQGGRLMRKEFTFEQFVVGGSNDFAYSAALALAAKKKVQQNSLFLLSKTGMGKSHLSQAIGHHILKESPTERVYYMSAEDFTNEMVDSFKNNSISSFKEKYRNHCDVLLLEDVHHLSGKARTQIELSETFDNLFNANKKIIFSSCYLPSEIPKLDDTLRSRLCSGIISSMDKPDYQTRLRIIRKKARLQEHAVPDNVIEYLAGELTEDIRQLESGLIGITVRASLLGAPINLDLARNVVQNIVYQKKNITIEGIKKLICKYYNVSLADLVSRSRKQQFVHPRQVAIYLSRRYTDQPLQAIGKSFNRYHATAMHAIGVVEKGIKQKRQVQQHVQYLTERIEAGEI
jgi:chromosomal replication initiator protein